MTDNTGETEMTTYDSTTTLAEIRAAGPCEEGWTKLLTHLGKTKADDEPLQLVTVLESNGFDDALWCLQVPSLDRLSRHFQAWCADQVLHLFEKERPEDTRVRDQITMLKNDEATDEERAAARDAAWAAADAAAAARDAAKAAAWAAADAADAADAARAAAKAAAWAAALAAARDAAKDAAARVAQERHLRKMLAGRA